jgi:plasmid stabilization system protein ParE
VASLLYSAEALDDLDRLEDFLRESDPASAASTPGLILRALGILQEHPYMGQPADGGLRQLVISRGRTGYVALYRYREDIDSAIVLAIRHQREAGYPGGDVAPA